MFKKKNKNPKTQVSFFDNNDKLLFEGELDSIPIKEDVIIRKSIEFFNDHNPCYIHRGAVTVRLLGEIDGYMKMQAGSSIIVDRHAENVVGYIDIEGIHRMERSGI